MARMNGMLGVVVSSVGVLVVVMVGWFFFVSPQRSKADRLGAQVSAASSELFADQQLLATARRDKTLASARAAERALPAEPRVPALLRQLTAFAAESRTEIDNIAPGAVAPGGGAQPIPITLTFKGRYFGLQKLLKLLRQSAGVSNGKFLATGRLFSVDSIQFAGAAGAGGQGTTGDIAATIALNAFVYSASVPVPAVTPETPTASATAAAPTD